MEFAYMPGCSLDSTAQEYNLSTKGVAEKLGLQLQELEDWNCCGASSAHSLDHELSLLLPGRNILLAQRMGLSITTPCAACYNRLKRAQQALSRMPEVEEIFGVAYQGKTAVQPLLRVMTDAFVGQEKQQVNQLQGLRVVPYYGCLWVRPPELMEFDDVEHPTSMDQLLSFFGVEVLPWSYKVECCGGSLSLTRGKILIQLVGELVSMAREAGAQAMVTACPLCQNNLELRQEKKNALPIFYFTELMGLALGVKGVMGWWRKHIIDPQPLLMELQLINASS